MQEDDDSSSSSDSSDDDDDDNEIMETEVPFVAQNPPERQAVVAGHREYAAATANNMPEDRHTTFQLSLANPDSGRQGRSERHRPMRSQSKGDTLDKLAVSKSELTLATGDDLASYDGFLAFLKAPSALSQILDKVNN